MESPKEAIQGGKERTSTLLVQSRLDEQWWREAMKFLLFFTKQSSFFFFCKWANSQGKEDTTLHSMVQQNPLDQRYFIIKYPQQTRTSFVNSTQKSSKVFCLCLQRGDRWTKVPLVAGTEELKDNTASEVLVGKILTKKRRNSSMGEQLTFLCAHRSVKLTEHGPKHHTTYPSRLYSNLVEDIGGYLLGEEDDGSDLAKEPKDARCGSKTWFLEHFLEASCTNNTRDPWRKNPESREDRIPQAANFGATLTVSTTPQMTCFRGAKVCTKWLQEKVTINSYSLTTSWNWDQKWKIRNCPWLRGDTARCEHQWQHDHFHWLPHCLSVSAHCSVSSCVLARHISRTRTVAQVMSLSPHPHVHVHVSVSPRLALPFYFTHFLPHSCHFLLHLKFVDYNLPRTPHKESMDLSDEFFLSTGYEPNAYDFKETSVEPYTKLLDSPPLFSDRVSSADADYDDAALEGMLREAHRLHSHHSPREDLSVSLSSSSVFDRTGRPVGDRTGRPAEQRNQEAQIRTLLDKQKEQILAKCQVRINRHELQAAYDRRSLLKLGENFESQQEELQCARAVEVQQRDQQLLLGQLLPQNFELREAHHKGLNEMEELRKFQSSTFDTIARRKLVEDQNTKLALSGRIQDLQNETNCMSDSKEFQDAESIRSGNSHVTSRPVSFPPHPIPEGMQSRSIGMPSRTEGPPSTWDTHGISGNVFANPQASSSAPYPQELNSLWKKTIEEPLHMSTAEKSDRPERNQDQRCQSGPSAKNSVIFSGGDSSKNYGADQQRLQISDLHFWKIPYTSNVCLLEDKIQDWGMYLFTISYGSYALDQRSGDGWFSGWF